MAGDIIRSINGEPVTSTNEAISYVKTHADVTTHWVAVVERQGKEITLTYDYHAPSK
jgi:S1-C subfamily serine protease